jgi:hypothetical protein
MIKTYAQCDEKDCMAQVLLESDHPYGALPDGWSLILVDKPLECGDIHSIAMRSMGMGVVQDRYHACSTHRVNVILGLLRAGKTFKVSGS